MLYRVLRCWLGAWLICGMLAGAASAEDAAKVNTRGKQASAGKPFRPTLLLSLPDKCNTPDGMRLDKTTNDMIVACPNVNDLNYPGALIKITPDNRWKVYFDKCPKHPETGHAHPMGMDFGPDGNLYYADNQYFNDKNKTHRWSRVIRVNIKDGKPVNADVVVEGFKLSNAVMFKGDDMFVTDTFFDLPGKHLSGVYRIALSEMQKGRVVLKPKEEKDPHLLVTSETEPFAQRGNDSAGADGMTFDSKGNLYYGHFGDGQLFKVMFNPDGSVQSKTRIAGRPQLICCDGMFCDVRTDKIYITDSARNAIQVVDTNDNSITTLWENDDTNGADGLLDQPCEPAIRGADLMIVNFDMPFPGLKNTKYDRPHTISVIRLKGNGETHKEDCVLPASVYEWVLSVWYRGLSITSLWRTVDGCREEIHAARGVGEASAAI